MKAYICELAVLTPALSAEGAQPMVGDSHQWMSHDMWPLLHPAYHDHFFFVGNIVAGELPKFLSQYTFSVAPFFETLAREQKELSNHFVTQFMQFTFA